MWHHVFNVVLVDWVCDRRVRTCCDIITEHVFPLNFFHLPSGIFASALVVLPELWWLWLRTTYTELLKCSHAHYCPLFQFIIDQYTIQWLISSFLSSFESHLVAIVSCNRMFTAKWWYFKILVTVNMCTGYDGLYWISVW